MQLNTIFRFAFGKGESTPQPAWEMLIELSDENPEMAFVTLHWNGKEHPTYWTEEKISDLEFMVKRLREESDARTKS